jgi:hypothetical protein
VVSESKPVSRRDFLNQSLTVAGSAAVAAAAMTGGSPQAAAVETAGEASAPKPDQLPCGKIGKVTISRLLLGGNLISGFMHCRDLKYVNGLFRAYVTEEKILETLRIAEECGINTVFETGARHVQKYNRERGGHMQFIPHIEVSLGTSDATIADHISKQVASGAVALYVWGVAADQLVKAGAVDRIAKAVELAKKHGLPVGVGGHSLEVPMQCEKAGVPCDFYVKTLHSDEYPSATPKALRTDFMWMGGNKAFYDNMWCINPEETIEFMKTVTKPWIAFKVLAAGAFLPRQGFQYAFKNGADFIAVGMLDFQIKENSAVANQQIGRNQQRVRPWRA